MAGVTLLRWVRALTLAAVMLVSGLAGHVAMGGAVPATSLLVVLLAGSTLVLAPFVGTLTSVRHVVLLLAVGQGVMHAALQLLAGATAVTEHGASMVSPGGVTRGTSMSDLMDHGTAPPRSVFAPAVLTGTHLGMLLGHLAAALVVGVWLSAGERAVWALLTLAARPVVGAWSTLRELTRAVAGTPALVPIRTRPAGGAFRGPARMPVWLGCGVSRRGPPRLRVA